MSANTGGTLWAVFQWNGPLPIPDHINVLLRTTVSASADTQSSGLSSSATATDSTFGETASAPGGVPLVTGRHLLRVPISNGVAQVSLGGNVTATATNSVAYGTMGTYNGYPGSTSGGYYYQTNGPKEISASASIGATAAFDNREVTINSPTIEDSYYKSAFDSQHGTDRYLHQPAPATGAMSVDSMATYSDADNAHGWIANATLVASPVGFSKPTYVWASDFNPVAMVGVDMSQQSIPAGWFIGDGSNLPITKNITVTATDADGASAANTYTIK